MHAQTGTDFYQLAYVAATSTAGAFIPSRRTGDRELSPLIIVTGGATARGILTSPESAHRFSLLLQADYSSTHYYESLYFTSRSAFFGTLGVEAELE